MANKFPDPGSVVAFRTKPFSEFAPASTGRYAALKVLGSNADVVVVAALSFVGSKRPSLSDVRSSKILRQYCFLHTGRHAVWGVGAKLWALTDLDDAAFLGVLPLENAELQFVSDILNYRIGTSFSTLHAVDYAAEGEWRWANDQEAFIAEHEQLKAKQAARRAADEERYRTRLRGLTWEKLLGEVPFARWSPSPPFPSEDFVRAARDMIHQTCRILRDLGEKPRKADVRRHLKACVEWFNAADERAGGVIETEEREDICAAVEEMAYVARQKSLASEIDNWRTW